MGEESLGSAVPQTQSSTEEPVAGSVGSQKKSSKKKIFLIGGIVLVIAGVICGGIVLFWPKSQDDQSTEQVSETEPEKSEMDKLAEEVTNAAGGNGDDEVVAKIDEKIEEAETTNDADLPELYKLQANALHNQGDYDHAILAYDRALLYAKDANEEVDIYIAKLYSYIGLDNKPQAIALLKKIIEMSESGASDIVDDLLYYKSMLEELQK